MKQHLKSWTRSDLSVEWFSGQGAGGQHRNKHQNCVRIRDLETGLVAVGQSSRSRKGNMRDALTTLARRLKEHYWPDQGRARAPAEDVVRTYHEADNRVTDHASGKKWAWGVDLNDPLTARKGALAAHSAQRKTGRMG